MAGRSGNPAERAESWSVPTSTVICLRMDGERFAHPSGFHPVR